MSEGTSFSRQSLLAAAPTLALVPANAVRASADPIFAALAKYKRLDDLYGDCCHLTDAVAARNEGRLITEEDRQVVDAAADASERAFNEFLTTIPTTLGGMKTFITAVLEESVNYEAVDTAMQTALKSPVFASIGA